MNCTWSAYRSGGCGCSGRSRSRFLCYGITDERVRQPFAPVTPLIATNCFRFIPTSQKPLKKTSLTVVLSRCFALAFTFVTIVEDTPHIILPIVNKNPIESSLMTTKEALHLSTRRLPNRALSIRQSLLWIHLYSSVIDPFLTLLPPYWKNPTRPRVLFIIPNI